jgi:protein CpxP
MKLNKTLALAAVIAASLFAGNLAVQAQDATNTTPADGAAPKAHGNGMMNLKRLTKQLDLTSDESTNVQAALADQMQKIKDVNADTSLSDTDKRAKLKEIHKDFSAKMKTILTDDQYTKFQKMAAKNRRPMPTPSTDATSTNAPAAN